jgi:hypothetical protein
MKMKNKTQMNEGVLNVLMNLMSMVAFLPIPRENKKLYGLVVKDYKDLHINLRSIFPQLKDKKQATVLRKIMNEFDKLGKDLQVFLKLVNTDANVANESSYKDFTGAKHILSENIQIVKKHHPAIYEMLEPKIRKILETIEDISRNSLDERIAPSTAAFLSGELKIKKGYTIVYDRQFRFGKVSKDEKAKVVAINKHKVLLDNGQELDLRKDPINKVIKEGKLTENKKYKKGQTVQYQLDKGSPKALKPSVGTISKVKKVGTSFQYTIQDGGPVPVWGAEIIGLAEGKLSIIDRMIMREIREQSIPTKIGYKGKPDFEHGLVREFFKFFYIPSGDQPVGAFKDMADVVHDRYGGGLDDHLSKIGEISQNIYDYFYPPNGQEPPYDLNNLLQRGASEAVWKYMTKVNKLAKTIENSAARGGAPSESKVKQGLKGLLGMIERAQQIFTSSFGSKKVRQIGFKFKGDR